jgi:hypothetical protein
MILVISCNDESREPIHGGLVKTKEDKTEYTVMVDDNFHFMDEDERYTLGTFPTKREALDASLRLVGQDLLGGDLSDKTAEDLIRGYQTGGEDPFIVGVPFSAWDYAEELAHMLAGKPTSECEQAERHFRNGWVTGYLVRCEKEEA